MPRPRESDIYGKATQRVETAVSDPVKEEMILHWRRLGFNSEAEYVRELIYRDMYGSFHRLQSMVQKVAGVIPGNTR